MSEVEPEGLDERTAEAAAPEGTVPWGDFLAEARQRLTSAEVPDAEVSARLIVAEAAGFEGPELFANLGVPATKRGVARFDAMIARRLEGEPLQYVLGRWAFRTLDLLVDRRVLIPRPETEEVAGWALEEFDRLGAVGTVVDLGTGSGALGLSFLAERPGAEVWLTDRSPDAVAVARANLAGLGRLGTRGRLAEGSWFEALPAELLGAISVIVSNPPYVADDDPLPSEVVDWEPSSALIAAEGGRADLLALVEGAPSWLSSEGALVLELDPSQAAVIAERAAAGFAEVEVRTDLSGRDRAVVARRPRS